MVEDIIENGVRHTLNTEYMPMSMVEDIIQSGVKETNHVDVMKFFDNKMEDTLQNGVKLTGRIHKDYTKVVEYLIENGVRKTYHDTDNYTDDVEEVIREGVKETKTPGKDGDILSTIEWMKENKSNSYTKMIDDVIENGVKEIRPSGCVDPKTGIFHYRIQEQVDDVVDNGVKEIKTPNKDGDIQSTLEWMYKNNYQDDYNGSKMINKVIKNGVKVTKNAKGNYTDEVDDVIDNGEKVNGTFVGGKRQKENIESVIGYGTKNPTD
jgi:predicted peroxiredoxin